jgi:hypothetical protein
MNPIRRKTLGPLRLALTMASIAATTVRHNPSW